MSTPSERELFLPFLPVGLGENAPICGHSTHLRPWEPVLADTTPGCHSELSPALCSGQAGGVRGDRPPPRMLRSVRVTNQVMLFSSYWLV